MNKKQSVMLSCLLGFSVLSTQPAQAYTAATSAGFLTTTPGAATFNDFDGINNTAIATVTGGGINGGANPGAGGNWISASGPLGFGGVNIQFTAPQDYFGLYWGTNDTGTYNQVDLFNGATLLGTVFGLGGPNAFWNINAVGAGEQFDRVVLSAGGCCFEVDNFAARSVNAVPEPETYAMMLAGLGLLGFAARRRKQKDLAAA